MMIGPAPMMRIVEMSVRFGIYPLGPGPGGGGDRLVTTHGRPAASRGGRVSLLDFLASRALGGAGPKGRRRPSD